MNMKIKKYDDLTVINGIGPARQDWLRNKLGVLKYQNLAGLSPEELLVQLKKDNLIASRNEVNRWISKAQELADANKASVQGEWAPFASFVVEFQARRGETGKDELCTTVQHMEADKEEMWIGIETDRLCHWMRDRIGNEVPEMKDRHLIKEQSQPKPDKKPPSILNNQLKISQPPNTEMVCMSGQACQGLVRSNMRFELQDHFSIQWSDQAKTETDRMPCYAQFYARSLPSGELIYLGDSEAINLVESKADYGVVLTGVVLPAGMYSLKVFTRIPTTPPVFAHLEIPLLQVF